MEKTITFEMTETQAEKFEKILDATLKKLNKMEKESPERAARFDAAHEKFMREIAETKKMMDKTSQQINKWKVAMGK